MNNIALGLVTYQDKILVGHLKSTMWSEFYGLKMVLPGGRMKGGESVERQLIRNIKEKTGLEVIVHAKIGERLHPLNENQVMSYFHCEAKSEILKVSDMGDFEYFSWETSEIALQLMPTLYSKVVAYIIDLWKNEILVDGEKLERSWFMQPFEKFGDAIRAGELVAFPTETVYGLGANAYDATAVAKIFEVKGRPADNPLIVHVSSAKKLDAVASELSPLAKKLYEAFSPGPLTVILPKRPDIPDIVTARLPFVGVRIPNNGIALEFLAAAQVPVAAPSANISGKPSSTHHLHVKEAFGSRVKNVIEAGLSHFGVESTVVKVVSNEKVAILRQGAISKEQIQEILPTIEVVIAGQENDDIKASPGTRYRHYAPQAQIILFNDTDDISKWNLSNSAIAASTEYLSTVIFSQNVKIFGLGSKNNPEIALKNLYRILMECDKLGVQTLYIEIYPQEGQSRTFMERISRAAGEI